MLTGAEQQRRLVDEDGAWGRFVRAGDPDLLDGRLGPLAALVDHGDPELQLHDLSARSVGETAYRGDGRQYGPLDSLLSSAQGPGRRRVAGALERSWSALLIRPRALRSRAAASASRIRSPEPVQSVGWEKHDHGRREQGDGRESQAGFTFVMADATSVRRCLWSTATRQ